MEELLIVSAIWDTSFGKSSKAPPESPLLCCLNFFQAFPYKAKLFQFAEKASTNIASGSGLHEA